MEVLLVKGEDGRWLVVAKEHFSKPVERVFVDGRPLEEDGFILIDALTLRLRGSEVEITTLAGVLRELLDDYLNARG